MRKWVFILMTLATPVVAEERFGAIESRPLWDRPAMGLTLQQGAEEALDRGNGRIVDEATFELTRIERDRVISEPQRFWEERERAIQIENARRQMQREVKKERIVEVESQRLAAERERWLRTMNKPRHGEAAVLDGQTREGKGKQ